MSGGPVFNDSGRLCGLISTGTEVAEGQYEATVSSLWPTLGITVDADRGDKYPRGVSYRAYELARDQVVSAHGWERVHIDSTTGSISLRNS